MNDMLTLLNALTAALLKMSLQASVVIALVFAVQWLLRRHLSPRVRYALWLLVVLRLALPISLESSVSVFQWGKAAATRAVRAADSAGGIGRGTKDQGPSTATVDGRKPEGGERMTEVRSQKSEVSRLPDSKESAAPATIAAARPAVAAPVPPKSWPWAVMLSTLWLAGVVFLLARIIWIPLRLNAGLARHETATPPAVFEILEQAKRLIGVNQVLPIVQSRAVESPALLGFIRPWLLLPHGMFERFTPQEMRLVFLHELAHLRRRDIAVNWLTTLLQIVHWFNPLVWLAFAQMRADRELACDELALSLAPAEENKIYGQAIIKLLEGFTRPAVLPGLVGILEDQRQMEKRITMIAQFRKMTGWTAAAAGLFVVLGIVTLTDGQTEKSARTTKIFTKNGPTTKILLSGTSLDVNGVLAPDESAVAYTEWGKDGGDLMVRDLRSGESKVVAVAPRSKPYNFAFSPVWSADAKTIAYSLWIQSENTASMRSVSREGGEARVIQSSNEEWLVPEDWSRDGQWIVGERQYWKKSVPAELAVLNVTTGELRSLVPQAAHPRFSPDGRFIACDRLVNGNRDVFIISVDGARTTRVTTSPAEDSSPIFSPDGQFVLFSSNQRGSWDLWALRVENGTPIGTAQPVRYDIGDHHKWITTSGKLAYRISGSGVDGAEWTDVFEISADRSPTTGEAPLRPITRTFAGRNLNPAFSPDGTRIAHMRYRSNTWYPWLCVQTMADGVERVFEPGMRHVNRLFWSPDGKMIAMAGIGEEQSGEIAIYIFSVPERRRTAGPISSPLHRPVNFTRDGREILFVDFKQGERVAVNITTKAERRLPPPVAFTELKDKWALLYWDEMVAVYRTNAGAEQQLVVADADLRHERVVAHVAEPWMFQMSSVSPDGKKIVYTVRDSKNQQEVQLHVAAVDGSWDRVVDTGAKFVRGGPPCSWSPDSARFVQTLRENLPAEIGVLENFLPPERLAAK